MRRPDLAGFIEPGTEAADLVSKLDLSRLPRHVAIIMDGNGRWAGKRLLPRVAGHRAGIAAVRETVETAARLGLEVLTLYAFSRENWKRPKSEIDTLMALLREYLARELGRLMQNDIRFRVIGRIEDLYPPVQAALRDGMDRTSGNSGLLFNIALSYSGRSEIAEAAAAAHRFLRLPGNDGRDLDEDLLASFLTTAGQPDPDLLIRTSGELRISNFLLWQIAYAEIFVTEVLWPDFNRCDLLQAILAYQQRERRYGGIEPVEGPSRGGGVMARTR